MTILQMQVSSVLLPESLHPQHQCRKTAAPRAPGMRATLEEVLACHNAYETMARVPALHAGRENKMNNPPSCAAGAPACARVAPQV